MLNRGYSSSVEQKKYGSFYFKCYKPFHVLLKSWGAIIFNFQWVALENARLTVYVGMMDDYGLCLMVIECIVFYYYFFLGK